MKSKPGQPKTFLIALLVGVTSSTALACPVPLNGKEVTVDGRTGVLVSREGLACLDADFSQTKLEVIRLREAIAAKERSTERLQSYLQAESDILIKSRKALEESRDAASPSLIDSPVLWFAVGVVVTSVAVVGVGATVR